jgi:hypothetical protein
MTERRWIPVSERMPQDGKAVLVLDNCPHADRRFIGMVLNGEWCDNNFYILDGRRTPTHWMPLPAPPSDKGEVQFTHGDDITVRLTRWCEQFVDRAATQELMDEAAREIERLRNGAVEGCETVTFTDAEREAIEESMRQNSESDCISTEKAQEINATLRNLLARLA